MIKNLSEQTSSFGLCPPRSYYIPFGRGQKEAEREQSGRFVSLNGEWGFRAYEKLADIGDDFCTQILPEKINVPSCVQYYGYDYFQYTNVRYPFPYDPPRVPVKNPAYHYSRDFSHDGKGKLYLVFEGVDSCFYVYVNGRFVGFSQISHRLSEFDVTDFAVKGKNRLDVVVQKWCTGSYFEDQDKWRFTGIFRDVYLLKREKGHIIDYKIETSVSDGNAEIVFSHLSGGAAEVVFGGRKQRVEAGGQACFKVEKAELWSAENPILYDLEILSEGERIFEKVGIRTIEIRDRKYLFNGQPIKFRGVNRHDFHSEKGAAVSLSDIEEDLRLMKTLNINAIRTSHYPSAPEFYKLCDKYGFYVISESDLETHGTTLLDAATAGVSGQRAFALLSDDSAYEKAYVERQIVNVETNKNRPCVAFWSMGNESGWGRNFVAASAEIRRRDSRPIHYESSIYVERPARDDEYYSDCIDIQSRMYPSVEWMRDEYLPDVRERRPLFLCEYAHAMGNSPGGLKEYWDLMESNDSFMGGCIWEWADHGVSYRGGAFRYGGDFGELIHDGNFCIDGIVTPDRKIKSGTLEMKKAYQPLSFERTENGISAFNKNYFSALAGKLVILYKNYGKEEGREELNIAVGPREGIEIPCRDAQTVLVRFFAGEGGGVPEGTELASEGFFKETFVSQEVTGEAEIFNDGGVVCVHTENADYRFDGISGEISSVKAYGKDLGGIRVCTWRAPTNNDWSVDRFLQNAVNEAREISFEGSCVTVKGNIVYGGRTPLVRYILRYIFGKEGFDVEAEYLGSEYFRCLPRFGMGMKLGKEFDALCYCAYGPQESYSDKHLGTVKDVYRSKVSEEYSHLYIKPQESGSHFGADFAEVSDGKIIVRAEGMNSFSAIGYSAEILTQTKHDDELPVSDAVYFNADFTMSGIGSNSCGPELPLCYRVPKCGTGRIAFRFGLKG